MDWTWYLFSFNGRVNRAKYWLAALIVGCWMIFLAVLTIAAGIVSGGETAFGFDVNDLFRIVDPASYRPLSWAALPSLLIKVIGTTLFLWVYVATSIKRLHDRDRSGRWMVPFFVIPGLYQQFADRLPDSYFVMIPAVISFALCIWGFVEMYCLRGTRWTNQYGPNPLGKEQNEGAQCASPPARDNGVGPGQRDRNGAAQGQCALSEVRAPLQHQSFANFGKRWALAS